MPVTPPGVGTTGTGSKPMSGRWRWGSRWRAALLAAAMAAGVVALGPPTAQAGATAGTVGEVRLSSDAAGELTISWDPPASTPSDYRVMWAEASQDYLSWKADNEATRGNSYPEGSAASLTLTGLAEGAEYKVRMRSRYSSGGPHGPWSGPWTDEKTQQVRSGNPAADPALDKRGDPQRGDPQRGARDEPLLDPPLIISDGEDDENLQFAEQTQAEPRHVETPVVTLVSSLGGTISTAGGFETRGRFMSFTTGSSPDGYTLTGVTVNASGSIAFAMDVHVSVLADSSGVPGASLYAFPAQTIQSNAYRYITFAGEMSLEPDTTYWLNLDSSIRNAFDPILTISGHMDSGGQSGWSLGNNYHHFNGNDFRENSNGPLAVRLRGKVSGQDFAFDASTRGRLGLGVVSSGVLSDPGDRFGASGTRERVGDMFRLEGVVPGRSYRVRAWFGSSRDDAATSQRGGSISLMFARSGSSDIGSLSPHEDDLLDDGRAMFTFGARRGADYWVSLVAPAFSPTAAFVSTPSYSYYGPYELGLVDLGPTQRRICPGTGTSSTNCTPSYTAGHGIKAANVCHNKRCEVDPRLQHLFTSTVTPTETVTMSVGNDPTSKNLVQAAQFTLGSSSDVGAAKFKLDRIEAFIHDTAGASKPTAAIYSSVTVFGMGNVPTPNQKLFDLESPPTFGRHLDQFIAPDTAPDLDAGMSYWVVFSESGTDTNASYKLWATTSDNQDEDRHAAWGIARPGATKDDDASSPAWASMVTGTANTSTTLQIAVYATALTTD